MGHPTFFEGLVGLPLVGAGLGQAYVRENTVDELAGHLCGGLWAVVEGGDDGEDGGSGVGGELHVAEVDAIEWGFADAEDEGAAFLEADVGGALDEVGGEAVGYAGEGAHGAGKDDHGIGGVAAAGDVGSDVCFGVLLDFGGWCAEEFLCEFVAAAQVHLFGEDAEGAVGGDEVYFGDACVGCEGSKHLSSIEGSAGPGDGEGDVPGGLMRFMHRNDYLRCLGSRTCGT